MSWLKARILGIPVWLLLLLVAVIGLWWYHRRQSAQAAAASSTSGGYGYSSTATAGYGAASAYGATYSPAPVGLGGGGVTYGGGGGLPVGGGSGGSAGGGTGGGGGYGTYSPPPVYSPPTSTPPPTGGGGTGGGTMKGPKLSTADYEYFLTFLTRHPTWQKDYRNYVKNAGGDSPQAAYGFLHTHPTALAAFNKNKPRPKKVSSSAKGALATTSHPTTLSNLRTA